MAEKVTVETVGRLATDVEDATAAARELVTPVTALLAELRSDRTWRHWILAVFAVTAMIAVALGVWLIRVQDRVVSVQHDNHKILTDIEAATGPAAQARSSQQIGQVIQIVVGMVDCNTRRDLAQVLHVALPATPTCPAVSG